MHRSGVIPCRWPWELLERSGSSSLGGPEKVATVKVTSILPPRLSFVFFSLFPNVSDRLCIRARITHTHVRTHKRYIQTNSNGSRPPYSRASNLNSLLHAWCMCTRLKVPPDCARNENETENADPKILLAVVFEKKKKKTTNSNDSASNIFIQCFIL